MHPHYVWTGVPEGLAHPSLADEFRLKYQALFSLKCDNKYISKFFSAAVVIGSLTLVLLNPDILCFANSVDPDQLASEEANWSGSALFAIQNVNLYQQSVSRNLIGWKFVKGVAS